MKSNTKKAKIPAKYNGYQLDGIKTVKYGFFIDYLVLNLQGAPNADSKSYDLKKEDYGTRVFENRAIISNSTDKIGTLLWQQRSNTIKIKQFAQLKLENHLFYTKSLEEIHNLIKHLLKELNLTFYSINRLDLALDFENKQQKVEKLIKRLQTNEILLGGKDKDINYYQHVQQGKVIPNGVTIGKRTSSKFCRLYNKTNEMQKTMKHYIQNCWKALQIKNEVFRLEYQLNGNYLRNIENLSLKKIFNIHYIVNLFEKATENHFKFHINKKRKEVNKMPLFEFISFDKVKRGLKVITTKITKLSRTIKESLIGQKRQVKSLLRSYFSTNQKIEYLLPLKQTLTDFDLWKWYEKKHPFYIREFQKAMIQKTFDFNLYHEHQNLAV